MSEFDAPAAAQIATGVYGVVMLVELEFDSGTIYLSTHNEVLTIDGHAFTPLGGVLRIGTIKEKAGTGAEQLPISIPSDPAYVALALGGVEGYRGRPARVYLQLLGETYQPVGARKLRFTGRMEPVSIPREPAKDGSSSGRIEMKLTREGLARSRKRDGARLTDAQQQAKYPGDTGLRYMRTLIEKPSLWLSIAFQKQ